MCKQDLYIFKKCEVYDYWTNFTGLNHIVSDGVESYPFDGEETLPIDKIGSTTSVRPYLYDFFWTKEEMRDININKIIK